MLPAAFDVSTLGPLAPIVVVVGWLIIELGKQYRRVDKATEARISLLEAELDRCRKLRGKEATTAQERILELENQLNRLRGRIKGLK